MSNESKKCANDRCTCIVTEGKYCSQICEDAVDSTAIACDCPHKGCAGHM